MQRNSVEFRSDTFNEYMQAPCGRLLSKIVLHDLNQYEKYADLKRLRKPFGQLLREGCTPTKTTIYIHKDYIA
ncbi:MAG: hypothetical protein IKK40_04495 [Bacteroidales bacterium]|nr:hypothetical protein [Bacteroidales bacterium]MBR6266374.1 hypothetical protein [Bacteroidales bacterium]